MKKIDKDLARTVSNNVGKQIDRFNKESQAKLRGYQLPVKAHSSTRSKVAIVTSLALSAVAISAVACDLLQRNHSNKLDALWDKASSNK